MCNPSIASPYEPFPNVFLGSYVLWTMRPLDDASLTDVSLPWGRIEAADNHNSYSEKRCNVISTPTGVSSNEKSWMCPLCKASLGRGVPGMMRPLDDVSLTNGSFDLQVLKHLDRLSYCRFRIGVPRCGPGSGKIGQGRHVQGKHRPSDALYEERVVQGTHCPSDASSETFCFGTHRSGTVHFT